MVEDDFSVEVVESGHQRSSWKRAISLESEDVAAGLEGLGEGIDVGFVVVDVNRRPACGGHVHGLEQGLAR